MDQALGLRAQPKCCRRLVRGGFVLGTAGPGRDDSSVFPERIANGKLASQTGPATDTFPVTPFERSGLAFGCGHKRFASAILKPSGSYEGFPDALSRAIIGVCASPLFSSAYNSSPIGIRFGGRSFKRRYGKRHGTEHFSLQRALLRRGASDTTLTCFAHNGRDRLGPLSVQQGRNGQQTFLTMTRLRSEVGERSSSGGEHVREMIADLSRRENIGDVASIDRMSGDALS
jgi:hypothetical protein